MNNLRLNQGPLYPDVLFMGNAHRASEVFAKGEAEIYPMDVRRGDGGFWNTIRQVPISQNVKNYLINAGFGGIIDCHVRNIDHSLIHALVERWRPETNTFHLPVGELTVTLQDVNVLLGLPVEGRAVTGHDVWYKKKEDRISRCLNLLGYRPRESDIKGGMLRTSSIYSQLLIPLPEDASEEQCVQRARMIIMCVFGGVMFADGTTGLVPLVYLSHLEEFERCGEYSWGSAVLACLYRNLSKATLKEAGGISGPIYLLQIWAWERFRCFQPTRTIPYHFKTPYGDRYALKHKIFNF